VRVIEREARFAEGRVDGLGCEKERWCGHKEICEEK
jgi:hypothetical protein